jgi:hypothetical protein
LAGCLVWPPLRSWHCARKRKIVCKVCLNRHRRFWLAANLWSDFDGRSGLYRLRSHPRHCAIVQVLCPPFLSKLNKKKSLAWFVWLSVRPDVSNLADIAQPSRSGLTHLKKNYY